MAENGFVLVAQTKHPLQDTALQGRHGCGIITHGKWNSHLYRQFALVAGTLLSGWPINPCDDFQKASAWGFGVLGGHISAFWMWVPQRNPVFLLVPQEHHYWKYYYFFPGGVTKWVYSSCKGHLDLVDLGVSLFLLGWPLIDAL